MNKKQQPRETGVFKYLPDARDLYKFAAYGFVYHGFTSFMEHQVKEIQSGSSSSKWDRIWGGLIAAGRGGLVGAYQTPIYACMENALTVSHRDKSRTRIFVSSAAAVWGSTLLFRNVPCIQAAISGTKKDTKKSFT